MSDQTFREEYNQLMNTCNLNCESLIQKYLPDNLEIFKIEYQKVMTENENLMKTLLIKYHYL